MACRHVVIYIALEKGWKMGDHAERLQMAGDDNSAIFHSISIRLNAPKTIFLRVEKKF
jgi:hypothetical protein